MSNPYPSHHERNLNTATLGTLMLLTFHLSGGQRYLEIILLIGLGSLWTPCELFNRLVLRRSTETHRVASLPEIVRTALKQPGHGMLLASPVLALFLGMIGVYNGGTRGLVIGLCCGLVYIGAVLLWERYPVDLTWD